MSPSVALSATAPSESELLGMRSQWQNARLRQSVPGTLGCIHSYRLRYGEIRWDGCVGKVFDRADRDMYRHKYTLKSDGIEAGR